MSLLCSLVKYDRILDLHSRDTFVLYIGVDLNL